MNGSGNKISDINDMLLCTMALLAAFNSSLIVKKSTFNIINAELNMVFRRSFTKVNHLSVLDHLWNL